MNRLFHVIAFTSQIDRLKNYYRDQIGLEVSSENPYWVSFGGPGGLALLAVQPEQKREIELCFESDDVRSEVEALRDRGVDFAADLRSESFGQVIHLRDPEGNLLSLLQPAASEGDDSEFGGDDDFEGGTATAVASARLANAIVHVRDLKAASAFYAERLGLPLVHEDPLIVVFETGPVILELHSRTQPPGRERQFGQPVKLGLAVPDLIEWAEVARERGVHFTSMPADEGRGVEAEVVDPDGNVLRLYDPDTDPDLEETLAEPFDEDESPQRAAIRRPVSKSARAVSRVVLKPEYKSAVAKSVRKPRRKSTKSKVKGKGVASTRGAGPERTRLKPKRVADPKRARTLPATGRLKKAERKTLTRKKVAVASASKSKPVKRAVSRITKSKPPKRTVARRGKRR